MKFSLLCLGAEAYVISAANKLHGFSSSNRIVIVFFVSSAFTPTTILQPLQENTALTPLGQRRTK